jgi:hypothetical protein
MEKKKERRMVAEDLPEVMRCHRERWEAVLLLQRFWFERAIESAHSFFFLYK